MKHMSIEQATVTNTYEACERIARYLDINPFDLEWIDGEWTVDGMDPQEWLEAMELD